MVLWHVKLDDKTTNGLGWLFSAWITCKPSAKSAPTSDLGPGYRCGVDGRLLVSAPEYYETTNNITALQGQP